MRSVIRPALGIVALVQVTVLVPVVSGQAADQHACSLFQPGDLLRITGRNDIGGRGPQASKPGELRAGTTQCDFLNISMTLTQSMTPAWFARNRKMSEDAPDRWKVQSVSGLGDEAYYMWDPRPGPDRNMGLVFRAGSKQLAIGQLAAAGSIESSKPMLMQIARLLLPKMK